LAKDHYFFVVFHLAIVCPSIYVPNQPL